MPISMPPASAGFAARGGWLINDLCIQFMSLTEIQAAGIVGNLGYESGLLAVQEKSPVVPGSRGGYGWAQWTGPRRRQFEQFCADKRLDPSSDEGNYQFLIVELTGSYKGVITALKQTTALHDAVALVERAYEGPAESRVEDRLIWAQKALSGVGKADPTAPEEPEVYVEDLYNSAVAAAAALQSLLKALGLYQGEVDGAFGPQSSAAAMQAWRLSKESA